jgi:hypothetical protein
VDTTNITDTTDGADSADTTDETRDADAFENLNQGSSFSSAASPEQVQYIELSEAVQLLALGDPPDRVEADNSEPTSELSVDGFPYGNAGAPIHSGNQGLGVYESAQAAFSDAVWAPFRSQCDWEIARWAKMRRPTSTAVTELLAIPNVSGLHLWSIILLMVFGRLLRGWVSPIRRQMN